MQTCDVVRGKRCLYNNAQRWILCLMNSCTLPYEKPVDLNYRPLAVGVVMTCSGRHVGVHKCIAVIERKRVFTSLCMNAGSYSDMACIL